MQLCSHPEHFFVPNSASYHALREAVSLNTFVKVDDSPWPTAKIEKANDRGHAQLIPAEAQANFSIPAERREELVNSSWNQRAQLSDSDADVLDLLYGIWLHQASGPNETALVEVDQLLALRGLKSKLGGGGHYGGYREEQRDAIFGSIQRLEALWITLAKREVYVGDTDQRCSKRKIIAIQSRALIVTDRIGDIRRDGRFIPFTIRFRPGDLFAEFLFGPGRQIALLSVKTI